MVGCQDPLPDHPAHGHRQGTLSDRDAHLRRVYREHVEAIYAFFGYAVPRATAEDLTASTFERVIRSWSAYDPARGSERTWILTIARNLLTDHYRRQSHRQAASLDEHPALIDAFGGEDPSERLVERDEVRQWLSELQPRERELLALRYGADLSTEDIARYMDLTVANVHQILSRSLRRLREHVESLR